MNDLLHNAAEVVKKIQYINIATVTREDEPWNTPVYTAFDKDLRFFWISAKASQHSVNLKSCSRAFVTIYDSTVPEGTGFGVYFTGRALQIRETATTFTAIKKLYSRVDAPQKHISRFLGKSPRRLYVFVPERVWVNGWFESEQMEGVFYDERVELDLERLTKKIFEK
ncbi:MAG: pyridoxamine 5'-phosphate oxidase family protein [Candidatus Dojkabacteria bacterium]